MKRALAFFLSLVMILCLIPEISFADAATAGVVTDITALADGDTLVILYGVEGQVMGEEAASPGLSLLDATVAEGILTIPEGAAVLTYNKDETGITLKCGEKFLTSAATGSGLTLEDEVGDCSYWAFEELDGDFVNIKNLSAVQTIAEVDYPQYLAVDNGTMVTLGLEDTDDFKFTIYKVEAASVEAVEASPAGGAVYLGSTVTLTCATEGAEIFYKINAGAYAVYSEPVVISSACKLTAYAQLDGVDSDETVWEFTIKVNKTALQTAYEAYKAAFDAAVTDDPMDLPDGASYLAAEDAETDAAALSAALAVLNKANATQSQVNKALTALNDAWVAPSVVSVDKSVLQTAYDAYKTVFDAAVVDGDPMELPDGTGCLTEADVQTDAAALAEALAVLDNAEATQKQVNDALAALNAAWIAPTVVNVDKTDLAAAYDAYKAAFDAAVKTDPMELTNGTSYLTEADAEADDAALTAARAVLDYDEATQTQVNDALATLDAAWIVPSVVEVDKSALQAAYDEYSAALTASTVGTPTTPGDDTLYITEEEAAADAAALEAALAVLDDAEATQTDVNTALEELNICWVAPSAMLYPITYTAPAVYSDDIMVEVFAVTFTVANKEYTDYVCVPTNYADTAEIADAYKVDASAVVSQGTFLRYDITLSDIGETRLGSCRFVVEYDAAKLALAEDYKLYNAAGWNTLAAGNTFDASITYANGAKQKSEVLYSLYFRVLEAAASEDVIPFIFTVIELGLVDADGVTVDPSLFTLHCVDGSITISVDKTALQLAYDVDKAAYDAVVIDGDPMLLPDGASYLTAEDAATDAAALEAALVVLADEAATQTEINAALEALNDAWIAPDVVSVDKTDLQAAYDAYKAAFDAAVTDDPMTLLDGTSYLAAEDAETDAAALEAALEVLANEAATQTQVNEALTALNDAWVEPSVVSVDKTDLQTAYDAYKAAFDAAVTDDPMDLPDGASYLAAEDAETDAAALSAALLVLEDPAATQAQVNEALTALNDAWVAPSVVSVDKSVLQAAYDDAEAAYDAALTDDPLTLSNGTSYLTEEDATKDAAALEAAFEVLDDETATQTQVNDALAALAAAWIMPSVVEVVKTDLAAAYDACKAAIDAAVIGGDPMMLSDGTSYLTEADAEADEAALAAALAVLDNAEATQQEVNDALAALEDAWIVPSVVEVDKTALQAAYDEYTAALAAATVGAPTTPGDDVVYVPEADAAADAAALEAALAVLDDPAATQTQVDAALDALSTAWVAPAAKLYPISYTAPTVYSNDAMVEVFAVTFKVANKEYTDYVCIPTEYADTAAIAAEYDVDASAVVSQGMFLRCDITLSDIGAALISSGKFVVEYDTTKLALAADYKLYNASSAWGIETAGNTITATVAYAHGAAQKSEIVCSLYFQILEAAASDDVIPLTFTKVELGLINADEVIVDPSLYTLTSIDGSITISADKTALQDAYDAYKAAYDAAAKGDPMTMPDGTMCLTEADAATDAAALEAALAVLDNPIATQVEVNAALNALNTCWVAPAAVTVDKAALQAAYDADKAEYDAAKIGDPMEQPNGTVCLTEADAATDAAALAAALTVLEDVDATQAEVNEALEALNTTWIAPTTVAIDKTALQSTYDAYKAAYDAATVGDPMEQQNGTICLTEADAATDVAALAAALTVLEDVDATQAEVNDALAALNAAWIAPTTVAIDKTALQSTYDAYKAAYDAATVGDPAVLPDDTICLTAEDAATDAAALAAALEVLEDAEATQKEVNDALAALNAAWIAPASIAVDKSALQAAYDAYKAAYDTATIGDPETMVVGTIYLTKADAATDAAALAAALTVLDNAAATQTEVNAALTALNDAWIAPTQITVDKTALQAAYDAFKAAYDAAAIGDPSAMAVGTVYLTEANAAVDSAALDAALAVLKKAEATQTEVNAALAALNAAWIAPSTVTLYDKALYGDANCDGFVTTADAAYVLRYSVRLSVMTEQGMINADVDGKAGVTTADAAAILRYTVKLEKQLPIA